MKCFVFGHSRLTYFDYHKFLDLDRVQYHSNHLNQNWTEVTNRTKYKVRQQSQVYNISICSFDFLATRILTYRSVNSGCLWSRPSSIIEMITSLPEYPANQAGITLISCLAGVFNWPSFSLNWIGNLDIYFAFFFLN